MTGGRPSKRLRARDLGYKPSAAFGRVWLGHQFTGSAAIDVMTVRRQQWLPGIYFRKFPVRIAMMFLVCRLPRWSTWRMVRAGPGLDPYLINWSRCARTATILPSSWHWSHEQVGLLPRRICPQSSVVHSSLQAHLEADRLRIGILARA